MNHPFRKTLSSLLAASLLAVGFSAFAGDEAPAAPAVPSIQDRVDEITKSLAPPIADANGNIAKVDPGTDIDKISVVPLRGIAMMRNKKGQVVLVSDTGRFVMANVQILDTWNKGAILTTPEQMEYYGERLDPSNIPVGTMAAIHFGTGKQKLTAFVDPRCHYCHELYTYAQEHKSELSVTFILLPILGPDSEALARRMTCQMASKKAKDEDIAAQALISGDYTALTTDEKCDINSLRSNLVAASVLGIHGVPFVYGDDGRFVIGLPQPDVLTWLKTAPAPVAAQSLAEPAQKVASAAKGKAGR